MAYLLGTAGHVDHGKTSLIKVLTGVDTDRLPEEKRTGMTIELGFAPLQLPKTGRVSVVDVPGHAKFLTNMLAGATAVDVALLCISAVEGIKPQTVEHLRILELLPVKALVTCLTFSDLVSPDDLTTRTQEVSELLVKTRFVNVPVVPVSSTNHTGIPDLIAALDDAYQSLPIKASNDPFYLPIDRTWVEPGLGILVTGSLCRGELVNGVSAKLLPSGNTLKIRSIQSHGESLVRAQPGSRVALNVTGVEANQIKRGQIIAPLGTQHGARSVVIKCHWQDSIKHAKQYRLAVGADDILGTAYISAAQPGLIHFEAPQEFAVIQGQPCIVLRHSPYEVLAAGTIVAINQERPRASRSRQTSVSDQIVAIVASTKFGVLTQKFCDELKATPQDLGPIIEDLQLKKEILGIGGIWFNNLNLKETSKHVLATLDSLHSQYPGTPWLSNSQVVTEAKLDWPEKSAARFMLWMSKMNWVEIKDLSVRKSGFTVAINLKQAAFLERLTEYWQSTPLESPTFSKVAQDLKVPIQAVQEIVKIGTSSGHFVELTTEIYYTTATFNDCVEKLKHWAQTRAFTASEARDYLGTTRKYIIPLLEKMDEKGITGRRDDRRVFKNAD